MQEENGREERSDNACKRTVRPRRFASVTNSENRRGQERQPRFFFGGFRCGSCAKSRCHWDCRDRGGSSCARLSGGLLHLHRKPSRRLHTSRSPSCPSHARGNARYKTETPRVPLSPSRFCKSGICVSWAGLSSPRTLRPLG